MYDSNDGFVQVKFLFSPVISINCGFVFSCSAGTQIHIRLCIMLWSKFNVFKTRICVR